MKEVYQRVLFEKDKRGGKQNWVGKVLDYGIDLVFMIGKGRGSRLGQSAFQKVVYIWRSFGLLFGEFYQIIRQRSCRLGRNGQCFVFLLWLVIVGGCLGRVYFQFKSQIEFWDFGGINICRCQLIVGFVVECQVFF